ncbi:MAG TPA: flagella basal body P-ring formation protein FlgA [Gammaproteobacteria bacterium]|nr:flagella basal body P-ring formation protein FlgA [Gammaproteobacteria bacterium]
MPLITKLAFALLHATALTGLLSSSYVNAEDDTIPNSSHHQGITNDVHLTKESSQLRSQLIAWLAKQTQNEISEIEEKLVLNRSLEKRVCSSDLIFSYVESNKRLILADCKNKWRRYIKQPTWLSSLQIEPIQTEIESPELQTVLVLNKAVKKGERITRYDLESRKLALTNFRPFQSTEANENQLIAARDIPENHPLELSDIIVGKDVIVVKTTMPSGSTVSGDFVTKEFRFENVPSDAVVDGNNWSFMETNRRLVAGDILRERHLRKSKLVRRKDPVTLVHNSPALQIITTGVALQDGYFGQSVKVLNTESGRNVMGVVTGRGKVVIESER